MIAEFFRARIDFGYVLTAANIERVLQSIRASGSCQRNPDAQGCPVGYSIK